VYYVMIVTDIIADVCSVRSTVNWICQRIAWISNVLALSCYRVIGSEVQSVCCPNTESESFLQPNHEHLWQQN